MTSDTGGYCYYHYPMRQTCLSLLSLLFVIFAPSIAFAHEVYVLDSQEISTAMAEPSTMDFLTVIGENQLQFLAAAAVGFILVAFVFIISISKSLERHLDPFLFRIKHYAPIVTQITLAVALLASAYFGAFFGIELPMSVYGSSSLLPRLVFVLAGLSILSGVLTRIGAAAVVLIFLALVFQHGIYMTNYLLYFGESLALLIFGSAYLPIPELHITTPRHILKLRRFKIPIMRLFFAISLLYAAFYAKFLHAGLALATVEKYNLVQFFPFDPLFVVLGAFTVEVLIGLFYLLGIEIRFTSLFFSIFLILSVFFFQEAVWPHLVLLGTAISMAIHGYDPYTLEGRFFASKTREPVL